MNNKSFLILLGVACITGCKTGRNQYFTGSVEYAYSYISDSLDTDSLAKTRPAKGLFRYDTSNYQSRFTGTDTFTYYYAGGSNQCISETGTMKNYACEDYGLVTDSVYSVKDYATEETILGHPCRILEIQKKNSAVMYYYATDLKIAPATYKTHKAYNWDVYGERSKGGLILKLEHRFKLFTMKGIVSAINQSKKGFKAFEINDTLFADVCK